MRRSARAPMVVVGDLNIAPLENDVWDHKKMLGVVSHTPVEVEKFGRFYDSVGFVDAVRKFVPADEKLYSWWSYRAKDWEATNKGRRLDHIWATADIASRTVGAEIVRPARGWTDKPSDHVPVITRFT